jgi:NAD(P)-dependent dehydrogenase (short-subunit alcohol dehydrogenase family)
MDILISGASTGIGKACAIHLARLGHDVWAGVRADKDFEAVEKWNVRGLRPVRLDVTDAGSLSACVHRIAKESGTLHGLVNNAGIAIGGPVEGVSPDDWRRQFDINFFGAVHLTQICLPLLRESKGRIVNMSSISGRVAQPFMAPYAASKFALEAVSDSLRRELRRHGVKVSIVEPGAIATPIWEKAITEGLDKRARYPEAVLDAYGPALEKFSRRLDEVVRRADPAAVVVQAVEHALTARRPRARYPVGRGIRASALLSRLLPDAWLDRALR